MRQQLYETDIKSEVETFLNKNNNIVDTIQFEKRDDFTLVRIVVRGDTVPKSAEIGKLNDSLKDDLKGKPSVAQVRFIFTEIIEAPNSPMINIKEREATRLIKGY